MDSVHGQREHRLKCDKIEANKLDNVNKRLVEKITNKPRKSVIKENPYYYDKRKTILLTKLSDYMVTMQGISENQDGEVSDKAKAKLRKTTEKQQKLRQKNCKYVSMIGGTAESSDIILTRIMDSTFGKSPDSTTRKTINGWQ